MRQVMSSSLPSTTTKQHVFHGLQKRRKVKLYLSEITLAVTVVFSHYQATHEADCVPDGTVNDGDNTGDRNNYPFFPFPSHH
jgi:hypothetical protein